MWLVADHGFDGDVQALFVKLTVERQEVDHRVRTQAKVVSPSSGQLQIANVGMFPSLVLGIISEWHGDFATYPIVMMASLFWQLLVQMAILSPLGLTLTTAPHTSSLASSNDSPTKHKSCETQKTWHTVWIILFFVSWITNMKKIQAHYEICWAAPWKWSSYRLHPEAVKVIVSLLFIESHQPSTPKLVPVVLPHRLDAILAHIEKNLLNTSFKKSSGHIMVFWHCSTTMNLKAFNSAAHMSLI